MNKIRNEIYYLPREKGLEMLKNDGINTDVVYCVGGSKLEAVDELNLKGEERKLFWYNMHQPDDYDSLLGYLYNRKANIIYYDCRYMNGMFPIIGGNKEVIYKLINDIITTKWNRMSIKLVILAYEEEEE